MEDSKHAQEIGEVAIEYINSTTETDTLDDYLKEKLGFPVTVTKQIFPTYTAYNISYEVSVGDVRVSSVTIMPREALEKNESKDG